MRPRHRMPTIFTISMVDMLCCSLGCVILLWLLKADTFEKIDAKNKEDLARLEATSQQLAAKERDLLESQKKAAESDKDVAAFRVKLNQANAQADDFRKDLLSAQEMLQLLAQL